MFQQSPNINIWQQALKQKSQQITGTATNANNSTATNTTSTSNQQRTLIILGSTQCGKSNFLKILKAGQSPSSSNQQIKPTILFQYSYIKRQSINKQIIHCYQLSNKAQQQIIPSLINKQNYSKTKIIICIDLSKQSLVMSEIKQWIDIVRKQFDILLRQKMGLDQKVKQYTQNVIKLMEGQQDSQLIKPLPIETVIIGCKYDQLEKQDSQNRKWLNRSLRYFAHLNHCHLFYSSINNSTICSQIRNIFGELLFSNKRTFYSQKDHLKSIFISRGQDSIQSLGINVTGNLTVFDIIKKQINALYPVDQQASKKSGNQIDISKYSQTKIDQLIQQRKKQMLKITKGNKQYLGIKNR